MTELLDRVECFHKNNVNIVSEKQKQQQLGTSDL